MRILSDFLRMLSRIKKWPKILFCALSPHENFWKLTGMQSDPTRRPQNQKGNNQVHKLMAVYEMHSR